MTGLPSPAGLIMMWGLCAPLRLPTNLTRSSTRQGLGLWALLLEQGLGGQVDRQWRSHPNHGRRLVKPWEASPGRKRA
jgi:hypothetical protein